MSEDGPKTDFELLMLPLPDGELTDRDSVSGVSDIGLSSNVTRMNLARVDLGSLGADALSDEEIANTVARLIGIHTQTDLGGIALQCPIKYSWDGLTELLEALYFKGVPVLLLSHHDSNVWGSVNLNFVAGVVIENACILPNGKRRDYFRSRPLRDIMARSSKEREDRPEFFVGFRDLWEKRPHPSVIRRGVKLAEHFGAIIEHGPAHAGVELPSPVKSAARTLSGFEFLRRTAIIEVSYRAESEIE